MARTRKRTHSPQTTTDLPERVPARSLAGGRSQSGQKSVETARELSVQARATQEGSWGSGGLLTYLTQAGQLIAPWWSPRRDVDLASFVQKSDHLSGARALLIARIVTVPVRVLPRDSTVKTHVRQAEDATIRLMEESEFGMGWIDAISKGMSDYFSSGNGIFLEIIGEGKRDGPIVGAAQGIAHLDALRCTRTGDVDFPVLYRDTDGSLSGLHRTRVAYASDSPDPRVEMHGVGHCAVGRCVGVAQNLIDISTFKMEKLGSRPLRAILLGKGIHTDVVVNSLQSADEIMDNQGLSRFAKFPIVGDIAPDADLTIVNLSSLPDGFDEETSTRLGMFAIALAFGVPIRWIWPAATSGATKADAMYQHIAGLGGGIGKVLSIITMLLGGDPRGSRHSAGKFLPPHLKLVFDFQDDEQDRMKADIRKVRTEARSKSLADGIINVRVAREQALESGDLTRAQFNQLELTDGRLPSGEDIMTLFYSGDSQIRSFLDLGVPDALAVEDNDREKMLQGIKAKMSEVRDFLSSAGTRKAGQDARQALVALSKLHESYSKYQSAQVEAAESEREEPRKKPEKKLEEGEKKQLDEAVGWVELESSDEDENETIERGLSGRVKAMVQGAMGALLGHSEKQKVEPRGKPLEPFTEDEVPISDKDIDAAIATWNERMPKEAKGVLEARVPTSEEEAQAARDLEKAGGKV